MEKQKKSTNPPQKKIFSQEEKEDMNHALGGQKKMNPKTIAAIKKTIEKIPPPRT